MPSKDDNRPTSERIAAQRKVPQHGTFRSRPGGPCPSCGGALEQDEINNGGGMEPCGPLGCPSCYWIDGDEPKVDTDRHHKGCWWYMDAEGKVTYSPDRESLIAWRDGDRRRFGPGADCYDLEEGDTLDFDRCIPGPFSTPPSAPTSRLYIRSEVLDKMESAYRLGYDSCEEAYAPEESTEMLDGSVYRECEACGIGETLGCDWSQSTEQVSNLRASLSAILDVGKTMNEPTKERIEELRELISGKGQCSCPYATCIHDESGPLAEALVALDASEKTRTQAEHKEKEIRSWAASALHVQMATVLDPSMMNLSAAIDRAQKAERDRDFFKKRSG